MGGCCQVNSGKNEAFLEDAQYHQNYEGQVYQNNMKARSGNARSFIDVKDNNSLDHGFLNSNINVILGNQKDLIAEEFKPLVKSTSIIFNFEASLDEQILPVWVEKGNKLKFQVFGQWNIFDTENYFNCQGINDSDEPTPYDLPVGALCAYIQGGNVFPILPETEFTAPISGPLVLFQNNGDYDVRPQGTLLIILDGATKISIVDIEKKQGWNPYLIDQITSINFMSPDEKAILYYLNKLRTNPVLFGTLYLNHRKGRKNDNECIEFLKTLTPINPLIANFELYKAAKLHCQDMAISNLTGHLSSNGKNLKDRLEHLDIDINKIGENCSYGITNPLAIVLELLVDETDSKGHRRNLLDPEFEIVGTSLEKHPQWNISCVQDFSKKL